MFPIHYIQYNRKYFSFPNCDVFIIVTIYRGRQIDLIVLYWHFRLSLVLSFSRESFVSSDYIKFVYSACCGEESCMLISKISRSVAAENSWTALLLQPARIQCADRALVVGLGIVDTEAKKVQNPSFKMDAAELYLVSEDFNEFYRSLKNSNRYSLEEEEPDTRLEAREWQVQEYPLLWYTESSRMLKTCLK